MAMRRRLPIMMVTFFICFFMLIKSIISSSAKAPYIPNNASYIPDSASYEAINKARRDAVRQAFKFGWNEYEKNAYGKDIFHPISLQSSNLIKGGAGWMIIDSLDTMMIMDFPEEVARARKWISHHLDFDKDNKMSVFETTIRMLGGLLSAYHLSNDKLYLDKALDLGERLLNAFNETESSLPMPEINLKLGHDDKSIRRDRVVTAEVGTLTLEFKYLAHLTRRKDIWNTAQNIIKHLQKNWPETNLHPAFLDYVTAAPKSKEYRLGSHIDSFYEYLIKSYLQTSKTEPVYRKLYDLFMVGMKKYLLGYSVPGNFLYVGQRNHGLDGALSSRTDHFTYFVPAMIALGVNNGKKLTKSGFEYNNLTELQRDDLNVALKLAETYWNAHQYSPTKLSPDSVYFSMDTKQNVPGDVVYDYSELSNRQRPEYVESLWTLYRTTGDPKYREWGWEIFQGFENYTKTPNGYVGLVNVLDTKMMPNNYIDNTESFWYAETLKYLYLLFSDDNVIPLDQYVLTTEAHPLPCFVEDEFPLLIN